MPKVIEPRRTGRHDSPGLAAHEINWRNPTDADLLGFLQGQVRRHDLRHYGWVKRARLQLAWAAGDQLKIWDDESRRMIDSYDVQSERIALFVNKIKPAILNWTSLVTSRPVSFRVHPATSDDDDLSSARVQDKLARYYWKKLLGDDTFLNALWMMFCTGIVFLKSTWDPLLGDEFEVRPHDLVDEPVQPEGGNGQAAQAGVLNSFRNRVASLLGINVDEIEQGDSMTLAGGDLTCGIITGFQVIPPHRAPPLNDCPWIILRETRTLEEMRYRYGKAKTANLTPAYSEPYLSFQDNEGLNYEHGGSEYGSGGMADSSLFNHDDIIQYEIWRPRLKGIVPDGFLAVISQEQVLMKGKNPYDHGELPLVSLQELPSPKSLWPSSTVQDLMGMQAEINITRSQVAEHKAATVEPRIIAEKGIGLNEDAFTVRNEIVEVAPGAIDRVRPWVPEPLPSYLPWLEQSLRRDWEDIARAHAPSVGKQTGTVKSGRHAIALQEADARLNAPMLRLLREGLAHCCRQWLAILHQFVSEERVITVIGDNSEPEVLRWSAEDLPSAEFNVECDLGYGIDRHTTIELVDMLTARGWLHPERPGDKEMVFRWLGQGVTHEVDESTQDRVNASVENQVMLAGKLPPISDGDDDSIHLVEHSKAQKGVDFRKAAMNDNAVEELFNIHKRNHELKRLEKQVRQKAMAQSLEQQYAQQLGLTNQGPPEPSAGGQTQRKQPPERARRGSKRPPPDGFRRDRPQVSGPKTTG